MHVTQIAVLRPEPIEANNHPSASIQAMEDLLTPVKLPWLTMYNQRHDQPP